MGIFNKIRNTYRALTGQISVEHEKAYREWSGYKGKISNASKEENLAVNAELQRRIYNAEGRCQEARIIEKKAAPILIKYENKWTPEGNGRTIFDREFKINLANYVRESFSDKVGREKLKDIYNSLMESYKECYVKASGAEIVKLEDYLKRSTNKAIEERKARSETESYVKEVYDVPNETQRKICGQIKARQGVLQLMEENANISALELKLTAKRIEGAYDNSNGNNYDEIKKRREAYRSLISRGYLHATA